MRVVSLPTIGQSQFNNKLGPPQTAGAFLPSTCGTSQLKITGKTYQREFDEMWTYVIHYQMAINCSIHPMPLYMLLLSILLEHQKLLDEMCYYINPFYAVSQKLPR